jgi:hypothetical protein
MEMEKGKRIKQAIAVTQKLIDRELQYSPDLRHTKKLAFYYSHSEKLNAMLSDVQS